jgi:hypothetical protein
VVVRRSLAVGSLVVAALFAAAWLWRDPLSFAWLRGRVQPVASFDAVRAPPPPDYANPAHWAALPDRADAADGAPQGADPDVQAAARANAFFVHPTTYYRTRAWNQPLDDAETNRFTDEVVIRGSATAYNGCCRVYAPRYRQAALGALPLFNDTREGERAVELAYRDVEAAFEHFLAHFDDGRPLVLASHSQGSLHARWLLERRIAGTPLADRLVAAYLIGYSVGRGDLEANVPGIPVCDGPEATGCVLVWNAVGPGAARVDDIADPVCVNPLTGSPDGAYAPRSANAGGVFFGARDVSLPWDATPLEARLGALFGRSKATTVPPAEPVVEPGIADAQCVDGRLVVREIRSPHFRPGPFWSDNYHAYDYTFFWMDLRRDATRRLAAFR